MAFTVAGAIGFEGGSYNVIPDANINAATLRTNIVHTGVYSISLSGGYYKIPVNTGMYVDFSMWINPVDSFGVDEALKIQFETDTGVNTALRLAFEGGEVRWKAYKGSSFLGMGAVLVPNQWFNLRGRIFLNAAGYIQTKVDGVDDLNITSTGTSPGGTSISYLVMTTTSGETTYFDDIVWGSGDWCPDYRGEAHPASADTSVQDWTKSSGSVAYDLVDDIPPDDDTSYLYATANAKRCLFETTDFNPLGKTLGFVVHWTRARKETADTIQIKQLAALDIVGGDEIATAALDLLTTYQYFPQILALAPDGAAWNNAKLNNLKIGVESVV